MTPISHSPLGALIDINTDDLLRAFGLEQVRRGRWLLRWLCRAPARRFAQQIVSFDTDVAELGLRAGARAALNHFVRRLEVQGSATIPQTGPLLIASNHPGLADTLVLFASIPRNDLLTLAADRPFLRALPHVGKHLILAGEGPVERSAALRAAARHLRSGGALLTFPAGQIEPDPAIRPGATELTDWSAGLSPFARLVPDLQIVPALVSGVISARALGHPLTRLRRTPAAREWLGATLQLLIPSLQSPVTHLTFAPPVTTPAATIAAARIMIKALSAEF